MSDKTDSGGIMEWLGDANNLYAGAHKYWEKCEKIVRGTFENINMWRIKQWIASLSRWWLSNYG